MLSYPLYFLDESNWNVDTITSIHASYANSGLDLLVAYSRTTVCLRACDVLRVTNCVEEVIARVQLK